MGAQLLDGVALGGNMSPHTRFQEGLELSRQALIPPEWPSLPAKEHHPHTSNRRHPAPGLGAESRTWTEDRGGLGARQEGRGG